LTEKAVVAPRQPRPPERDAASSRRRQATASAPQLNNACKNGPRAVLFRVCKPPGTPQPRKTAPLSDGTQQPEARAAKFAPRRELPLLAPRASATR
jgi:hypothetical protein